MIEQQVGAFKRQLSIRPGFDWHRADSSRNYGIGSMQLRFVLIGEEGAVQWLIGTDWFPEGARRHLASFPDKQKLKPSGWDLGYHAKAPRYEGQGQIDCDCLQEGKCYYDGSGLNAELLIEGFLNGGDEWIWNRLEAYYGCVFRGEAFPNFDPIIVPYPDERMALS